MNNTLSAVFLIAIIGSVQCSLTGSLLQQFFEDNTLPKVAEREGETTLVKLVGKAGLGAALSNTSASFTLFGPTNAGFDALPNGLRQFVLSNVPFLRKVLKNHVLDKPYKSSDLSNDLLLPTLSGSKIRINVYKNKTVFTASGKLINTQKANILASNGVLHELEGVMLPVSKDMVESVSGCPKLKTITDLIGKAGLAATLSGKGPFTVFVPTDMAFHKIPQKTIDNIIKNKTLLQEILEYHVLNGTYYSAGLSASQSVPTLNGADLEIKKGKDGVTVGPAKVISADVSVTNGVAHAIDTVLLPPSLARRIKMTATRKDNTLFFKKRPSLP